MRWSPAFLATLVLVAPAAGAIHTGPPPLPPPTAFFVFHDVIFDVNATLAGIEEKIGGPTPLLTSARASIRQAALTQNRGQTLVGDHFLTLRYLMETLTFAKRAEIEYDTRAEPDPEAAFLRHAAAERAVAEQWMDSVHERLLDLQALGVDLYVLDHALLAGDILTQGERILGGWAPVAQGWDQGQRADEIRNGLVGFAVGPALYARVAEGVLSQASRNAPDDPVGPIVGNATLRGVMDALRPVVQNRSVSVDRQLAGLVNANVATSEWLAALGATLTWARQQAPASVQHTLDDPEPTPAEAVIDRLQEVMEADDTMRRLAAYGTMPDSDIPWLGAHATFALREAIAYLRISEGEEADGNLTVTTSLRAAQGLGAASAAHTGLAILLLAAGESPPADIIHLPGGDYGQIGLEGVPPPDDGSPGGGVGPWIWFVGGVAVVVAAVAVLARRRRRGGQDPGR